MPESKANYREPPPIIPEELVGREYSCSACGARQQIDWLERQPFPKESVESSVAEGRWVPISFRNVCRLCSHQNDIVAETVETRGALLISADEAMREVNELSLFLLAGCGISPDRRKRIEAEVANLERSLESESEGRISQLHVKDIMDRKRWPGASVPQRLKYVRRASRIVRTNRVSKFVTAGVLTGAGATDKRYLRDQVFSAYCLGTLQRTTLNGISPIFAFDQVQRGKRNGWAEECMIGIRRYPLFVWYSRGAHIPDIIHVAPGSTTESKLADCIAFVTAREFERRVLNLAVDVDTRWYGYSNFAGFNGRGDLIPGDGVGFPWRKVFGLKSAR